MAIRPVPQPVPEEFNAARLFLEDVEEIVRIFTEAENDRPDKRLLVEGESLRATFEVGNQTCDEPADLKKIHPPFTHKFSVELRRTGFMCRVLIDKWSTRWSCYGLGLNEEWGTYHKLSSVFQARKFWRSLLPNPGAIMFVMGAMFGAISLASFAVHVPPILMIAMAGLVLVLGLPLTLFTLRGHSVVIFRSRSDHSSRRLETVWKVIPYILTFLLGMLSQYLAHKFWP
jgi:hypothetical protein